MNLDFDLKETNTPRWNFHFQHYSNHISAQHLMGESTILFVIDWYYVTEISKTNRQSTKRLVSTQTLSDGRQVCSLPLFDACFSCVISNIRIDSALVRHVCLTTSVASTVSVQCWTLIYKDTSILTYMKIPPKCNYHSCMILSMD